MRTGTVEITTAAKVIFQGVIFPSSSFSNPTINVLIFSEGAITIDNKNCSQTDIKVNIATTDNTSFKKGSIIFKNILSSDAPSILAASASSLGMLSKNL